MRKIIIIAAVVVVLSICFIPMIKSVKSYGLVFGIPEVEYEKINIFNWIFRSNEIRERDKIANEFIKEHNL